jgi:phage terminase small subunit
VRYRNATQAYDHAFEARGGSYETRAKEGQQLLRRPEIQEAIKVRQQLAAQATGVDVGWLLQRFLDIATADPRELIGLKVGACRYCYGDGHGYQWREREYLEELDKAEHQARLDPHNPHLRLPDIGGGFGFNATHPPHPSCPQCHGEGVERFVARDTDKLSDQALLLYGGVKVKKDGYEIIIADREKALELAGRILGAFNDKLKISGTLAHLVAVADIRKVDPQEAAKVYRDFVGGHLAAA